MGVDRCMQRELGYRVYLVGIGRGIRIREEKERGAEKEKKEGRKKRQKLPFQKKGQRRGEGEKV